MTQIADNGARALADRLGRVGVWLAALGSTPTVQARAAVAEIEKLGYGGLWIGESPTHKEAFTHAGLLLAATERLTIGTGIANIWVRDPTAMNAAATTLGEAYPDRFVLGLGASHAAFVNHRGHTYGKPLTAMRDYLQAIDDADYDGPHPPRPVLRVLGALRPRMQELARERTAGIHSFFVPPEHTAAARELLGPALLLVPEQAFVIETDPTTARHIARGHVRTRLALANYVNHLRALGFTDDDLADNGSDRLVDALVAWGDAETVTARVRQHLDAGADHVAMHPLTDNAGRDKIGLDQLRELAPALQFTTPPQEPLITPGNCPVDHG